MSLSASLEPDVAPADEPEAPPDDGVLPLEADGLALEPEAEPDVDGLAVPPPEDGLDGVAAELELEELLSAELEDGEDGEPLMLPDALPLLVPPAEDDGAPGLVAADLSPPPLSQLVNIVAPSARETATAMAESLINGPPWVGVLKNRSKDRAVSKTPWRHVSLTRVI